MIYGIGTDITSISRMSKNIEKHGRRFLEKICSDEEIDEGLAKADPAQYFAGRFAAKEAFFKAFGTGWGRGVSMKEVSVGKDEYGKPFFNLSIKVEKLLDDRGVRAVHLSITHESDIAQAIVVLEGAVHEKDPESGDRSER